MIHVTLRTVLLLALFVNGIALQQGSSQARVPYADCADFARKVSTNLQTEDETGRKVAVNSIQDIGQHATCFATFEPGISPSALAKILAEGLNNRKQQSSPSGSSAATSAVSKPSGSTSIIQDVGGFSATNNGSSFTFQLAPGDLVNQLAGAGGFDYCTASIRTKNCISPNLLAVLSPATFSVTVNTSTTGSQVNGMAENSGTAVPANLSMSGNALSFGGVAAKYGLWYPKKSPSGSPLAKPADALAKALGQFSQKLNSCDAYEKWQSNITLAQLGDKFDEDSVLGFILKQYDDLYMAMNADPTCRWHVKELTDVLADVSAYQAAIVAQKEMAGASVPVVGLEYDFTTPASKPSYHSAKLNFTVQSKASCSAQVAVAAAKSMNRHGMTVAAKDNPSGACPGTPASSSKTTASANSSAPSPNWTFSASMGADIYVDAPSPNIPSASHLRDLQAGAEITRVWHLSTSKETPGKMQDFLSALGDLSVVGAYYYQDQTSPSILKGPPSSITFNGLPTNASQVFATRGPINVGQVRFGLGTGKSTTFPIAVSYSNRSDLIVHPFVGVQFGVSYDLFGK